MANHVCVGCKKDFRSNRSLAGHKSSCAMYKIWLKTLNRRKEPPEVKQVQIAEAADGPGAGPSFIDEEPVEGNEARIVC
jgi:hypothetical protein